MIHYIDKIVNKLFLYQDYPIVFISTFGVTVATIAHYSQKYIQNTLIPNHIKSLNKQESKKDSSYQQLSQELSTTTSDHLDPDSNLFNRSDPDLIDDPSQELKPMSGKKYSPPSDDGIIDQELEEEKVDKKKLLYDDKRIKIMSQILHILYILKPLSLMGILILLGAFMHISLFLSILSLSISGVILFYKYTIYNFKEMHRVENENRLPRFSSMINQTLRIQYQKKKICSVFILLVFYCIIIPLMTYNSCIVDHVFTDLMLPTWLVKAGISYSSFLTRFFMIGSSCPIGAPCHAYITVSENPSSELIFNMHMNPNMQNIVVKYDTNLHVQEQKEEPRQQISLQAYTPEGLDSIGERTLYQGVIQGLISMQNYVLQVYGSSSDELDQDDSSAIRSPRLLKTYNFRTLPDENYEKPYEIIYAGDVGHSPVAIDIASQVGQINPEAIIIGGDIAYDNGDCRCYQATDLFLSNIEQNIYGKTNRLIPIIVGIGNHDIGKSSLSRVPRVIEENNAPSFYSYFPQTTQNGDSQNIHKIQNVVDRPSYFHFKIGNTINFMLDSGYMTSKYGSFNALHLKVKYFLFF